MRLAQFNLKSVSTLQTHEITNHKLQKTFILSVLHAFFACYIFAPRKKTKYLT